MRALGYELVDVENGYQSNKYHGIERLKTLDTKQIRSHDEILKMCSMQVDAPDKAGKCNEGDAYWKHASATLPPPRWREQTENPKRRRFCLRQSPWPASRPRRAPGAPSPTSATPQRRRESGRCARRRASSPRGA